MLTDEKRNSNAGGGGERVLWTAIALMQRTEPDVINVVYSGDTDASKEQIIAKAKVRVCFRAHATSSASLPFWGARSPHEDQVRHHACAAVVALCIP